MGIPSDGSYGIARGRDLFLSGHLQATATTRSCRDCAIDDFSRKRMDRATERSCARSATACGNCSAAEARQRASGYSPSRASHCRGESMIGAIITVLFVVAVLYLAYRRLPLLSFTHRLHGAAAGVQRCSGIPPACGRACCGCCWRCCWLLNLRPLRIALISRPFMRAYRRLLPTMSETEREALEAGTVWWDGELFTRQSRLAQAARSRAAARCRPRSRPSSTARARRCAACSMTSTSRTGAATCRRRSGTYIKSQGFFAMIIPKRYGGLEFSTYAHSCVLVKLASRSVTCASTVAVPNSLGPGGAAAALRHRGAEEPLPAAAGARRGDSLLRADRPARRLGCRRDSGHRRGLPRPVAGPRGHRPASSTSPSATSRWRRSRP